MALRTSRKMFLVTPHQMNHLSQPAENQMIRRVAENDLDSKMRDILSAQGLNAYEKIQKSKALLQRYLALIKQGEKEDRHITLTLSNMLEEKEEDGEEEGFENKPG